MKIHLILLLIIACSLNTRAQLPANESGEILFTDVVKAEGLSKSEIYDGAKFWIVSTLKSGDNMVELSGDESDRIVGTGNIILKDVPIRGESWKTREITLNFKFIILCKDDRYKYEVSNFLIRYVYNNAYDVHTVSCSPDDIEVPIYLQNRDSKAEEFRDNIRSQIESNINSLISDLNKSVVEKESDW